MVRVTYDIQTVARLDKRLFGPNKMNDLQNMDSTEAVRLPVRVAESLIIGQRTVMVHIIVIYVQALPALLILVK